MTWHPVERNVYLDPLDYDKPCLIGYVSQWSGSDKWDGWLTAGDGGEYELTAIGQTLAVAEESIREKWKAYHGESKA